jgi:hypothetical protein
MPDKIWALESRGRYSSISRVWAPGDIKAVPEAEKYYHDRIVQELRVCLDAAYRRLSEDGYRDLDRIDDILKRTAS